MIGYAVAIFKQTRSEYYRVKNSSGEFESFKPETVLMAGNLEQMTRTLIARVKKYRDRGFAFDDKKLEALYKDEALWGRFVEMVTPTDHSVGWQAL